MWILGATDEDQRKGIADYFTPTINQMKNSGGSNGIMGGRSLQSEEGVAPQATMTGPRPSPVTGGGGGGPSDAETASKDDKVNPGNSRSAAETRFRMVERADFSMFDSASSVFRPDALALVRLVAAAIRNTPNRLTVRGHTDSQAYDRPGASNRTLSTARADATRRAFADTGVDERRLRRIEGVADTDPFNPKDREDPRNRRISVTLLYSDA